jgi:hypothetical protein
VSTDPDKKSKIDITLDVTFPNTPCYMIDIVMKTTVSEADKDTMIKGLSWRHSNPLNNSRVATESMGKTLPFPEVNTSDSDTGQKIMDFLQYKDQCHVQGTIDVTKVTG